MGVKKLSGPVSTAISKLKNTADSGVAAVNGVPYLGSNGYNLSYDGTDDAVDLNNMMSDINVDTGTVSVWVRLVADSATTRLFSCQVDANNMIELLWVGSSNYFRGKYRANGNSSLVNTGASTDYEDGNWYHVVMTWDTGGGDKLQMYLNGSTANNVTGLDDDFTGSMARAHLGAKSDSSLSGFITGLMDEAALFNEVKNAAWVTSAYNSGVPTNLTKESGLIAYYRFENGSGAPVDTSDEGNNGALVSAPGYTTGNLLTV